MLANVFKMRFLIEQQSNRYNLEKFELKPVKNFIKNIDQIDLIRE